MEGYRVFEIRNRGTKREKQMEEVSRKVTHFMNSGRKITRFVIHECAGRGSEKGKNLILITLFYID